MERHIIEQNIRQFVLAGNAYFTLLNTDTGNRLTFRVRQPNEDAPHFVSVLTGPENSSDYTFLGTIFDAGTENARYFHGRRSRISRDAQSARVFNWFFTRLLSGNLPESVEIWHEGRCGRCGRRLTVPESIATGFGPVCVNIGAGYRHINDINTTGSIA